MLRDAETISITEMMRRSPAGGGRCLPAAEAASVLVQEKSAFRGPITPKPGHSTLQLLPRILDYKWGNRPTEFIFFY